jgi:hypothetical protein
MAAFLQFISAIIGASIIGAQLHNPIIGVGIWFITYAIMPYYPRGK